MSVITSELPTYSLVLMEIWRDVPSSKYVVGRPSNVEQDYRSQWLNLVTYYLMSLLTPNLDRHGSTSTIVLGYKELVA